MEKDKVTPESASKELATLPPVPQEDETHNNLARLIDVLEESLTPPQLQTVKEIGYSIGRVGASLADACFLARVTKKDIDSWINQVPEVKTYFDLKRAQYKYQLLEIVSNHALENKDVKQATKLLEIQFADEFNPSIQREMAKANRDVGEDIMDIAIAVVRRGAAQKVPINPENGTPQVSEEKVKYRDVKEVLK